VSTHNSSTKRPNAIFTVQIKESERGLDQNERGSMLASSLRRFVQENFHIESLSVATDMSERVVA